MPHDTTLAWLWREPDIKPGPADQEPTGGRLIGRPAVPVRVYLHRGAWDVIDDVAHASPAPREVGGLLFGRAWQDACGPVILIEAAVPALEPGTGPGKLRFSQGDWEAFREAWQRLGPHRLVVGWFHTHPGYGTAPSGYDRIMAERYFPAWWQLTYIIDPVHLRQGMYCWQDRDLMPLAGFWVYETGNEPAPDPAATASAALAIGGDLAAGRTSTRRSSRHSSRRTRGIAWLMALLLLLALAGIPGLPGSLPWLRAYLLRQASEASRLSGELAAVQDQHQILQRALAEARSQAAAAQTMATAERSSAARPAASSSPGPASPGASTGASGASPSTSTGLAGPAPGVTQPPPTAAGGAGTGTVASDTAAGGIGASGATTSGTAASAPVASGPAAATVPAPAPLLAPAGAGTGGAALSPPTLTAAGGGQELRYVVREGDTLWSISGRLLGDPKAYSRVAAINRIVDPDLILPGWELRIPTEGEPAEP